MLTIAYQDALNDLLKFREEVERKLTSMVAGFAYEITLAASENTPIGDEERLGVDPAYTALYFRRFNEYGIVPEVGFHKGAWYYSPDANKPLDPSISDPFDAANEVESDMFSQYKVGNDFYILGVGPGFAALENGSSLQAPTGIMQPTIEQLEGTYQINLQHYYNRG